MRTICARWAAVCLGTFVAACGGGGEDGGPEPSGSQNPPAGSLTYFEHAKPIIDAKCTSCHMPGGAGPFDMTSYAAMEDYVQLIKAVITDGTMPPWLAADGCTDYVADRSLDDDQIATLSKWVDDGALEGAASAEAQPLAKVEDYALSRVDRSLEMPVEYTALQSPDDYRCFVIDWPETTLKYVTGFRAKPGNAGVVHHVIAFLASPAQAENAVAKDEAEEGPGYTCFGGAGLPAAWIGSWAPGSRGSDFPPDTGLPVEPGSKVVLQVHYNTFSIGPQPDRTSVDLRLADSVGTEAWIQPWANPQWVQKADGMLIPAGEMDVTHKFVVDPTPYISDGEAITMYTAGLHMHTLGKSARTEIIRANGDKECLLDIPRWDFHWQGGYGFAQPKVFNPGDRLSIECHWDNPTAKDVSWGEGTGDEMCLGGYYLTR